MRNDIPIAQFRVFWAFLKKLQYTSLKLVVHNLPIVGRIHDLGTPQKNPTGVAVHHKRLHEPSLDNSEELRFEHWMQIKAAQFDLVVGIPTPLKNDGVNSSVGMMT